MNKKSEERQYIEHLLTLYGQIYLSSVLDKIREDEILILYEHYWEERNCNVYKIIYEIAHDIRILLTYNDDQPPAFCIPLIQKQDLTFYKQ